MAISRQVRDIKEPPHGHVLIQGFRLHIPAACYAKLNPIHIAYNSTISKCCFIKKYSAHGALIGHWFTGEIDRALTRPLYPNDMNFKSTKPSTKPTQFCRISTPQFWQLHPGKSNQNIWEIHGSKHPDNPFKRKPKTLGHDKPSPSSDKLMDSFR